MNTIVVGRNGMAITSGIASTGYFTITDAEVADLAGSYMST